MTTLRTHPLMPAGLHLLDRPARGHELETIEVVTVEGSSSDEVAAAQQDAWGRGRLGPHAVGVLVKVWVTRRIPTQRMVREHAMGQLTSLTEKVTVWEPHRVVAGRIGPILGQHGSFDAALQALLRGR